MTHVHLPCILTLTTDDTLKSFVELTQEYELRYRAMHPDPPRVSLEAAIQRWKLGNDNKNPSITEYDMIVDEWKSRDMVAKFLGIYSSRRFYSDWTMAVPKEKGRTFIAFCNRVEKEAKHCQCSTFLAIT